MPNFQALAMVIPQNHVATLVLLTLKYYTWSTNHVSRGQIRGTWFPLHPKSKDGVVAVGLVKLPTLTTIGRISLPSTT